MKSRLLAGAAAVILAIVGAMLVISYAQGADQRAVKNLEPVSVLVVKTAIPAGTPVESMTASLATEELPAAAVTDSSLKSLDDSTGRVAAVDLVPGEQLVTERLVAPEDVKAQGSVKIPAGLQEVSFQLEPDRVVGGRLAPGDHVGIFVSMDTGGLQDKADKETTKLTVRKALVTAVQRAPEAAPVADPAPTASADPNAADSGPRIIQRSEVYK